MLERNRQVFLTLPKTELFFYSHYQEEKKQLNQKNNNKNQNKTKIKTLLLTEKLLAKIREKIVSVGFINDKIQSCLKPSKVFFFFSFQRRP